MDHYGLRQSHGSGPAVSRDVVFFTRERAIFDAISAVDEYSAEDAARQNSDRHEIFLADAIPAWRVDRLG